MNLKEGRLVPSPAIQGLLALQVQDTAGIVERLLGFLEVGKPHVTAEAMIQIKDLLRRYPDIAAACISSISAVNLEVIPTFHVLSTERSNV